LATFGRLAAVTLTDYRPVAMTGRLAAPEVAVYLHTRQIALITTAGNHVPLTAI